MHNWRQYWPLKSQQIFIMWENPLCRCNNITLANRLIPSTSYIIWLAWKAYSRFIIVNSINFCKSYTEKRILSPPCSAKDGGPWYASSELESQHYSSTWQQPRILWHKIGSLWPMIQASRHLEIRTACLLKAEKYLCFLYTLSKASPCL